MKADMQVIDTHIVRVPLLEQIEPKDGCVYV